MNIEDISKDIHEINWAEFNEPEVYHLYSVPKALLALVKLDDSKKANEVGEMVINTIGNNHRGTYYPVILKALDIIIRLAKCSNDNKIRKNCALAILNDLYYFEPEIGSFTAITNDELKEFAVHKLQPFSDELK